MSKQQHWRIVHTDVPKKSESEDVWAIPADTNLRLVRFSGGHEYSTKEVRVELCLRSGGEDTPIAVGYGGGFQFDIDRDFLGNGTDAIVVRLINGDPGSLSMSAWWEGTSYDV